MRQAKPTHWYNNYRVLNDLDSVRDGRCAGKEGADPRFTEKNPACAESPRWLCRGWHRAGTADNLARRARFKPTAFEAVSFQRSYLRAPACSEEQGVEMRVVDEAVGAGTQARSASGDFSRNPATFSRPITHRL